MLANFV
jgi:hypothetical protein